MFNISNIYKHAHFTANNSKQAISCSVALLDNFQWRDLLMPYAVIVLLCPDAHVPDVGFLNLMFDFVESDCCLLHC